MNKKIIQILRTLFKVGLPLGIGAFIFYFVYRNMNWKEILSILQTEIRWGWIILGSFFGLLSHYFRAKRWQILLKNVGEPSTFSTAFLSIVGAFGLNTVIPRIGEISRCLWMNRYEKASLSKTIGTVVAERVADIIVILLVSIACVVFELPRLLLFASENQIGIPSFVSLATNPLFYIIVVLVLSIGYFLFKKLKGRLSDTKAGGILKNMYDGFKTLWSVPEKGRFVVYSFLVLFSFFLQFYLCFFAFDFTQSLSLSDAYLLFMMGTFAMFVPVQGGIGPWHFMIISSLVLFYAISKDAAGAFAFAVNTTQNLIYLLTGLGAWAILAFRPSNQQ